MTTASKANSRIPAPAVGENEVPAPRKNPASAIAAKAMAMATPYSRRSLMPISGAVGGLSAVARNARPVDVRENSSRSASSTTTATIRVSSGNQPIEMSSLMVIDFVRIGPRSIVRSVAV